LTVKTRAATPWFRACRWIHEHRWSATFGVLMVTGPACGRHAATGRRWPPGALHAARRLAGGGRPTRCTLREDFLWKSARSK